MSLTGHCYCGAVRWEATGTPRWCGYCHCESCRRNCAAPVTAFLGVANADFAWTGDAPATFRRGDVTRSFCATCGSPVAYAADRFPGEIHLYLAQLDDQEALTPTFHVNHAEALGWHRIKDSLPRYPGLGSAGGAEIIDY